MSRTDGQRRLLWLTAAVLLCLLLLGTPFASPEQEPAAAGPTTPPAAAAVAPGLLTGHPRGSLAGDHAVVEAVRRLPWSGDEGGSDVGVPGTALGIRSVVFVGDVPGARWALVVGRVLGPPDAPGSPADGPAGQSGLVAVWFGGPPGAPPESLRPLTSPVRTPKDAPLGLLDQGTGTLVVVTAPGDVVEVSERPAIAEDGSIYRAYRTVTSSDGVAMARLRPSDLPVSAATVYRVTRDGREVARTAPTVIGNRSGADLPIVLDQPRGPVPDGATGVVSWTAERLLAPLGLARHELRVTVVWAGSLPGPDPSSGSAAVVAATMPSGAVVVDGEWLLPVESASGGYVQGGDCGLDVLPAGQPVEQRVHVLVCEIVDPSLGASLVRSVLLVVAPPQVTLVRLYDGARHFLAELPTVDGLVIAPMPHLTTTVEAITADGISLGRTHLLGRGIDYGD